METVIFRDGASEDFFPKYHSALFKDLVHTQVNILSNDTLSINIEPDFLPKTTPTAIPSHVQTDDITPKRPRKNSIGIEYKSHLFNELITSQVDGIDGVVGVVGQDNSTIQVAHHSNKFSHYPSVKLSDALSEGAIMQLNTMKLNAMFEAPVCSLGTLRIFSSAGIPRALRTVTWQYLVGYLSPYKQKRARVQEEKRHAYFDLVSMYAVKANSPNMEDLVNLIRMDVERTLPERYQALFAHPLIKKILSQILLVWGLEHPLTGYFQGLNDIATPFLVLFLENCYKGAPWVVNSSTGVPDFSGLELDTEKAELAGADAYWCLCAVLDSLEYHNVYSKCGVHAESMMRKLEKLVMAYDPELDTHLKNQGVEYVHFAFRWMLCLFMRELNLDLVMLLWESYLTYENFEGFNILHIYVCASFLEHFRAKLLKLDFMELMKFLQNPPTDSWTKKDVTLLVERAKEMRRTHILVNKQ